MSGDVQPRKRKDKKRKKDDGDPIPYQQNPTPLTNPSPNDDFNIHVHDEGGTGGGICAKLVFFVLFFTLAVLIGLIITEHRGLTEVEVIERNSRFSQLFEGWIDKHPNHDVEESHDEQDIQSPVDESEENDDDEETEEDELPEESNENEDDEEMESHSQEEPEEQSQELDLENENEADDDDDDGSDEETNKYESKEADDNDSENEEEDTEEQQQLSEEADEEEREESAEHEDEEDDNEEKQISNEDDEESKQISEEDENDEEQKQISEEDENDDEQKQISEEDENDDEQKQISEEEENVSKDTDKDEPPDNDEREGDEKLTPVEEKEEGKIPEGSSSLAVKLGVGAALLVVAQHVLVKKWRSASSDIPATPDIREQTPDMTRRNTIVVPPDFKEIQPDIEQDDKEYSEELSDEEQSEHKTVKDKYTELRSTYTRSLSPADEGRQSPDSYEYRDEELSDEELEEELEEEDEVDEEEDDDEEESEEDDYNYERNEELLRRLDSKYGKLPGSKDVYEHQDITNKDDFQIRDEIDEAQKFVEKNPAYAVKLFAKILNKFPSSPRSIYGRALALDNLAEQRRSNDILFNAIELYMQLLKNKNVPDRLFQIISQQCIKRMRFVGQYEKVVDVHKLIIDRFPQDPKSYNDLSITYLSSNRIEEARSVLKSVLKKWPMDGVALVHYGFILKTTDNKLEEAVLYLKKGIETGAEGVTDGRFYFHLGDALARLGKHDEAMKVYEQGTKNGVFLSKYQRSLYNVPRLKGKPFWELTELPHSNLFKYLKQYWQLIRDEGMSVLNQKGYFLNESENLREFGDWKQFELYARGRKNIKNCEKTPFTCSIIDKFPNVRNCKRGQTKFSVIHPGTHIWPHCGPTNSRLRIHLGLKVPAKTYLRVASQTRSWANGEIFVFDDSFEHEVWHNGTGIRLVLIIDVWHHELTADEKKTLSPI